MLLCVCISFSMSLTLKLLKKNEHFDKLSMGTLKQIVMLSIMSNMLITKKNYHRTLFIFGFWVFFILLWPGGSITRKLKAFCIFVKHINLNLRKLSNIYWFCIDWHIRLILYSVILKKKWHWTIGYFCGRHALNSKKNFYEILEILKKMLKNMQNATPSGRFFELDFENAKNSKWLSEEKF